MASTSPPALGTIIPSGRARKIIYGVYAVAALIVGGAAAYFLGVGIPMPEVVVGAQAVIAYLGAPIGALAIMNTPNSNRDGAAGAQ